MSEYKEKEGLGGWLILVGLGLVLTPFILLAQMNIYKEIFSDGTWEALTLQSSDLYTPFFGVFMCFELLGNCVFLIAYICLAFLFFKKKRIFPRLWIIAALSNLAFILIDGLFGKVVFPADPMFDEETLGEVIKQAISCAIWIPYMLKSVRVRNTFVK
jgi:hypothetical protein